MSRTSQSFDYSELHDLSFTELFRLFVAMTRWHWEQQQRLLVEGRISDCCRRQQLQPAYAAIFRRASGEFRRQVSGGGDRPVRRHKR